MKKLFARLAQSKFIKLLVRDVVEAAVIAEPAFFVGLHGAWDRKALAAAALSFGVAFIAALRRELVPQQPGA